MVYVPAIHALLIKKYVFKRKRTLSKDSLGRYLHIFFVITFIRPSHNPKKKEIKLTIFATTYY